MKKLFILCASFLALYFVISVLPIYGEAKIYDETIRLHVIAESDSEYDQAMKLFVRDKVLEYVSDAVAESACMEDAENVISSSLDTIERLAEAAVTEYGETKNVDVTFDIEEYPTRYYDDFALPSGSYRSLIIRIGEGKGKNWWCVLFPRLCTDICKKDKEAICEADGYSEEQYKLINLGSGVKYRIRFRLLEILERLF